MLASYNFDEGPKTESQQVAQNREEGVHHTDSREDSEVSVRSGDVVVCGDKHNKIVAGDYVQVVDNATGRLIMQGFVTDEKTHCPAGDGNQIALEEDQKLLTLDNRNYFSMRSSKYTVYRLPESAVDENYIKRNYDLRTWRSCDKAGLEGADIFIEHSCEELDKEVEGLVKTLNKFSLHMKTTGSCSGHEKHPAWVSIQFSNIRALEDFLSVFEPFKAKMDITTHEDLSEGELTFNENAYFPWLVVLEIKTKDVGKPAYDALNDFDEYLNKVIYLRNKTFNSLSDIVTREKKRQSQR